MDEKKMRTGLFGVIAVLLLASTGSAAAVDEAEDVGVLLQGHVDVEGSWIVAEGATYAFASGTVIEADHVQVHGVLVAQPGHHDGPDLVLHGRQSLVVEGAILGAAGASYEDGAHLVAPSGGDGSSITLVSQSIRIGQEAVVQPGRGGDGAAALPDLVAPGTVVQGGHGGDGGAVLLVGGIHQLPVLDGYVGGLFQTEGGEAGDAAANGSNLTVVGGDGGDGGGIHWLPSSQQQQSELPSGWQELLQEHPGVKALQLEPWDDEDEGILPRTKYLLDHNIDFGSKPDVRYDLRFLRGGGSCDGKDGKDAEANGADATGTGAMGAGGSSGPIIGGSGGAGGTGPRGGDAGTATGGDGGDGCFFGRGGDGGDAEANGGRGGGGGRGGDGGSSNGIGGDGGPGGTGGSGGNGGQATGGKAGCGGMWGAPGAPGTATANGGAGGLGGAGGNGGAGNIKNGQDGAPGTQGSPGLPGTATTQTGCNTSFSQ